MISFVECSMAIKNVLMILLEICMILELILLLVRITCFSGKKKIVTAVAVFVVSFMFMGALPRRKFLSANASGLSGQCFNDGGYRIIALSLLGNPERETQILSFSVLLVCERGCE